MTALIYAAKEAYVDMEHGEPQDECLHLKAYVAYLKAARSLLASLKDCGVEVKEKPKLLVVEDDRVAMVLREIEKE